MSKPFQNNNQGPSVIPTAQAEAIALTLFQQASAFHQKKQFEQAQSIYESLLRVQPQHFEGLQAFGLLAYETKQYKMAISLHSKAMQINPKSATLYLHAGLTLQAMSRWEDALESYDKAISLNTNLIEARLNRGEVLSTLNRWSEALENYDAIIGLQPDCVPAHNGRGMALMGLVRIDEALACFDKAILLQPNNAESHCNRCAALNKLHRFDDALFSADTALEYAPELAEAHFNRGNSLQHLSQLEAALSCYTKAITLQPYSPTAYFQLAVVLHALNQLQDALLNCDKAIALNPNFAEALAARSQLLTKVEIPASTKTLPIAIEPTTPARVHKPPIPSGFERHYSNYQYRAGAPSNTSTITIDGHEIRITGRLAEPEIIIFENVLSEAECELLIDLSRPKLRPSPTFDRNSASGKGVVGDERTSEGAAFLCGENALIQTIETRLAKLMNLPRENGEEINILHYITGAEYRPHYDFFAPEDKSSAAYMQQGGQRVATLVMYLNDVEAGGETTFPGIEFSVPPRKGGGVFFSYCDANGTLDCLSLHGGAPVTKGEKWIATKWVRQRKYQNQ